MYSSNLLQGVALAARASCQDPIGLFEGVIVSATIGSTLICSGGIHVCCRLYLIAT